MKEPSEIVQTGSDIETRPTPQAPRAGVLTPLACQNSVSVTQMVMGRSGWIHSMAWRWRGAQRDGDGSFAGCRIASWLEKNHRVGSSVRVLFEQRLGEE